MCNFAHLKNIIKSSYMAFDIEMIKLVYKNFADRVNAARKVVGKPLTLTEKILYAHLTQGIANKAYERGKAVLFLPV